MWEGPQCRDRLVINPRPWLGNQVFPFRAAREPIFCSFHQFLRNWILFNVGRDKLELLRRLHSSIVVTILPGSFMSCHNRGRFRTHITHYVMHEFRQSPRLAQREERMPMIRHDHEGSKMDSLMLDTERE